MWLVTDKTENCLVLFVLLLVLLYQVVHRPRAGFIHLHLFCFLADGLNLGVPVNEVERLGKGWSGICSHELCSVCCWHIDNELETRKLFLIDAEQVT